jgi:hypothetical protein
MAMRAARALLAATAVAWGPFTEIRVSDGMASPSLGMGSDDRHHFPSLKLMLTAEKELRTDFIASMPLGSPCHRDRENAANNMQPGCHRGLGMFPS